MDTFSHGYIIMSVEDLKVNISLVGIVGILGWIVKQTRTIKGEKDSITNRLMVVEERSLRNEQDHREIDIRLNTNDIKFVEIQKDLQYIKEILLEIKKKQDEHK